MSRRTDELLLWSSLGGGVALAGWMLRKPVTGEEQPNDDVAGGPLNKALGTVFGKPLAQAIVSGGWGDRRPKHVGGFHYAIDLPAALGTPIQAVASGTVVWVDEAGKSTAGRYVVLKHGGVRTRYLHMSLVAVAVGQEVVRGEVIGLVGSTGFSSGPHLHLDVFVSDRVLAKYREQFGEPTPTFPRKRDWGTQVPAEALIPVDRYSKRVAFAAAHRGVQLLGTG